MWTNFATIFLFVFVCTTIVEEFVTFSLLNQKTKQNKIFYIFFNLKSIYIVIEASNFNFITLYILYYNSYTYIYIHSIYKLVNY